MKVCALVSGGKDSCYNMVKCVEHGHEIVCLANLRPPNVQIQELDSWMFQTVGHNVISAIAECMNLPLFVGELSGSSVQTSLEYDDSKKESMNDEVENLYQLLKRVKEEMPEVNAVSCGAIFSDYQRNRVENVCSRLGLISLSFLWRRPQEELLNEMIQAGMNCILIKTASMGLFPKKHLGKTLAELQPTFMKLKDSAGLNVCGEGGEYETLTLDCPLFSKRIVVDKTEIVMISEDDMGGVGHLFISEFHLEEKQNFTPLQSLKSTNQSQIKIFIPDYSIENTMKQIPYLEKLIDCVQIHLKQASSSSTSIDSHLYYVTACCNYDSELLSNYEISPSLEMFAIFQKLEREIPQFTQQMLHCVLQISDMTHFNSINQAYCYFFLKSNTLNRPSRVCIATKKIHQNSTTSTTISNGSIKVECLMDVWKLLPKSEIPKWHPYLNTTLFVQSVSEWAPACIGPYAQASAHEKIIRLAGQIPLMPSTMELCTLPSLENLNQEQLLLNSVELQMEQCLKNISRVLDGMKETSLRECFRNLVYLNAFQLFPKPWNDQNDDNNNDHYERMMKRKVNERLNEVLKRNNMCLIDSEGMSEQYQHVSQKKKNHLQLFPSLPWMVVYVNDLPRGALVEIHSFAWMKKLQLPSDDDDDDEEMEQQWNDLPSLVLKEDVSLMSSLSNVQSEKQYGELRATNIRVLRLSYSFTIATLLIRRQHVGPMNLMSSSEEHASSSVLMNDMDVHAFKSILVLNETGKRKPSILRVFCHDSAVVNTIQQLLSDWKEKVLISPYLVNALAEEDAICRLEMEYL